jgi:peptide subunit release factor 1 (eRF1)
MLQDIDLRRLSEMHDSERAFVRSYLNHEGGRGTLDQRTKRIRALLAGEKDELVHFDESMKLVIAWLDENDGGHEPCCVFACWAEDWVEGYKPGVDLPNALRIGSAPYIRPLAELQEEYSKFAVVVADNHATRIFTVTSAQAELEKKIRGDVKNRVKKGGWSQQRYARRRENELHHYAKEIGEVLEPLVRKGYDRIVLLGSKETLEEIDEVLSQAASEKVVGRKGVNVHEGDDVLLDAAFELFFEEEREAEERHWQRIKAESMSEGLAAVGPDEVLRAALAGRVDKAVVTRDAKLPATHCRDCDNVFSGGNERCKACGSASVFGVDYVDSLARHLELTRAELDFVDPIPGLSEVGDVAALLRY